MHNGMSQLSPAFTRVSTGIPGLDTVLGGGLLQSGIYIIEGVPGAGKTISGNQMCFSHIAAGGRVVYITLMSESHARMIGHLRSLSFYDASVVGDALYYLSGIGVLTADGLDGLLHLARQAVRDRAATLLVLDGLGMVQEIAGTETAMRTFIQQLQLFLEGVGCTALMLMRPVNETQNPVQTMVDGVITLRDAQLQANPARFLCVRKFRGSDYLRGDHAHEITANGIVVHPRTEVRYTAPWVRGDGRETMPFGAPRLDTMLGSGLLSGSMTLLYGAPGTKKTILGLQFLAEGIRREQPGLYFGFYEQPPRLLTTADRLGLGLRAATERGLLEWMWQPPLEQGIDALAEQLLAAVARMGVRRLVFDGLDQMRLMTTPRDRFPRFFAALSNELRACDVTGVFILESQEIFSHTVAVPDNIGSVADNVLFVRPAAVEGQLVKLLSIIKMRESGYDATIRQLLITDAGIDVADSPLHTAISPADGPHPAVAGPTSTTFAMERGDADGSGSRG